MPGATSCTGEEPILPSVDVCGEPILPTVDVGEFKQRQSVIWGLGDYTELSRILRPAAEALCDACAVSAGQELLDVAAGDGNFALAAAREGAAVVASDISPGMVARGRARAEAEGYDIARLGA